MIKTQIQIPEELYRRVKHLAEAQEWSLAETLRRAAELFLAVRPTSARGSHEAWQLAPPANTRLKVDPFADPDWRMNVNLSAGASSLLPSRQR